MAITRPAILQTPGAMDVAIETHSLSKTLNMTGWRIGFAAGNRDAIATLNKLKSNVDSKQFPAIDRAAGWALLHVSNDETLALYRKRRDILVDGLNGLGWKLRKPEAAFYIWVPCPPGYTSMTVCEGVIRKSGGTRDSWAGLRRARRRLCADVVDANRRQERRACSRGGRTHQNPYHYRVVERLGRRDTMRLGKQIMAPITETNHTIQTLREREAQANPQSW